jgi:hypothetical protein
MCSFQFNLQTKCSPIPNMLNFINTYVRKKLRDKHLFLNTKHQVLFLRNSIRVTNVSLSGSKHAASEDIHIQTNWWCCRYLYL